MKFTFKKEIYTYSLNCHPILNQIYDILTQLHNQGKQDTLCKVPAHIGIKGNEEADKAAKSPWGDKDN